VTRRTALAVVAFAAAFLLVPSTAVAHGLVGKQDLPIPRWLFAWAAAIVLVVSFVALALLWPSPRWQRTPESSLVRLPRLVDPLCGAVGVAIFVLAVYAGLAGNPSANENLLPTLVFVIFWVGLPIVSFLFGDVFRALNPWRAIGRLSGWLVARVGRAAPPEPLPYPRRLGYWPAAIGIVAFVWVELIYSGRTDPSKLALLALAYAVVQLVGMSIYGVDAWSRRADAFGVYFGLFARLSPLRWTRRALHGRRPFSAAAEFEVLPGAAALICFAIGTTSFDGFSLHALWTSIAHTLQDAFRALGLTPGTALQWAFTIGLLGVVGLVYGFYRLGIEGVRTIAPDRSAGELAGAFAHTLIPIALAYVIAHYFGLLAYQGQAIAYLASDPLGDGTNLFGTANAAIDYTWISATAVWYVQVATLVTGHAIALALAHDRALALYGATKAAVRSQYWMLAIMVGFTCLALWLLSEQG
jgi:hypothetical protein